MKSNKRGFITGIAVSLLVGAGVLASVHMASADSGGPFTDPAPASQTTPAEAATPQRAAQPPGLDPAPAPTGRYVALGDSVAAGLGLPLATNSSADQQCGRSDQSYARSVGRELGLPTTLYACSGATAGDLLTQQRISGSNPKAQIASAYADGKPSVISITAGANDIYWQRYIQKCYASTCGSRTDDAIIRTATNVMQVKLSAALESIRLRAQADGSSPPRVVVTGYYNPVSAGCANQSTSITANELTWLGDKVGSLNQALQTTASNYDFVRFAAVDFSGHDLCSAQPWVQGLNDAAPVHPTAAGQQAIAKSVVQAARQP